jgi:23S rRNA pseudouridine955/2504/2580 synthase
MILTEDDDYIIINKPPNISTLEDRNDPVNILGLARIFNAQAQVCHRLDKETSGILAIAKNPEAYRHLSLQFQRRQVTKIYHAVVDGIQQFDNILVDKPIQKSKDGVVKISKAMGKPAQTYFTSLRAYRMNTLVACRPITGRMHQIRIHLSTIGAPITGDTLYGGRPFFLSAVKKGFNLKKDTEEQPLIKRMALHAYALEFKGISGQRMTAEAGYPRDLAALIRQLELNP